MPNPLQTIIHAVARNLALLGCDVSIGAAVGMDEDGEILLKALAEE